MIKSKTLKSAVGIQQQKIIDRTSSTSLPSTADAVVIGSFKRGRGDKPFKVSSLNYKAILGRDLASPSYLAVEDAFNKGIDELWVIRTEQVPVQATMPPVVEPEPEPEPESGIITEINGFKKPDLPMYYHGFIGDGSKNVHSREPINFTVKTTTPKSVTTQNIGAIKGFSGSSSIDQKIQQSFSPLSLGDLSVFCVEQGVDSFGNNEIRFVGGLSNVYDGSELVYGMQNAHTYYDETANDYRTLNPTYKQLRSQFTFKPFTSPVRITNHTHILPLDERHALEFAEELPLAIKALLARVADSPIKQSLTDPSNYEAVYAPAIIETVPSVETEGLDGHQLLKDYNADGDTEGLRIWSDWVVRYKGIKYSSWGL